MLKQLEMGKYEMVDDDVSTMSANNTDELVSKPHWYGPRFQMSMLILTGVTSMVCHHIFYRILSGTKVNTDPVPVLKLSRQVIVSATGNTIASFATFVLGTAIGIAFVQILWTRLLRKSYAIQHIEAMISCRSSPFSPAALRSWRAAWLLSAIAALGSAMRLITIFAPGALRTETSSITETCTIQIMDLSSAVFGVTMQDVNNNPVFYPSPNVDRMVLRNVISGSYVPPPNFCGACSHNVSFNAPAMSCADITSQFDFHSMPLDTSIIWNVTHDIGMRGKTIIAATMEASGKKMEAANCTVYNATYSVEVTHNVSSTDVKKIGSPVLHQPVNELQTDAPEYMSLFTTALATAQVLDGFGQVGLMKMQNIGGGDGQDGSTYYNPYLIFSSLGRPGPQNSLTWEWDSNIRDAFPQLMANISISLLSNPMNAPMDNHVTQCTYSTVVYIYDQYHLLLSYGLGILLASLCVVAGFWSIRRNRREETLEFSRLMVAILTPSLLHEELRKSVRLKTQQDGPDGCSKFIVDSESQTDTNNDFACLLRRQIGHKDTL